MGIRNWHPASVHKTGHLSVIFLLRVGLLACSILLVPSLKPGTYITISGSLHLVSWAILLLEYFRCQPSPSSGLTQMSSSQWNLPSIILFNNTTMSILYHLSLPFSFYKTLITILHIYFCLNLPTRIKARIFTYLITLLSHYWRIYLLMDEGILNKQKKMAELWNFPSTPQFFIHFHL